MRSSRHTVHFVIKDRYIRFVESDKKNTFKAYGQKGLPAGVVVEGQIKDIETFMMILDEIVDQWNLHRSKITFCIPDSYMIIRKTVIPFEIAEEELKGYLYMQLGETLHLPFEDPIIEAVTLGEKEGQREVLLVASKESIIKDFTTAFEDCSLKPTIADLSILSLYRMYYHLGQADKHDHVLLVQLGLDTLQMSVFHQHKPEIVRHSKLPFSEDEIELIRIRDGQEFYAWKEDSHDISDQTQDVVMEMERFMNFYHFNLTKGNHQITKIILTGDHPCINQFESSIEHAFQVPIKSLLSPLFQTKKGINIPPIFSECIGLALK